MILGIIPARYASSRFPGKPLADIAGKSMVQRVYEQSKKAKSLSDVVVATDDERIEKHVLGFGGKVIMTSSNHPTGTDRCCEAMEKAKGDYKYVINIQGDEPFISPNQIDLLSALLDGKVELATLVMNVKTNEEIDNPNEMKVVANKYMEALYFSRSIIPFVRGEKKEDWYKKFNFLRHVGMYAYRADILKEIAQLSPSPLELAESLEQLRWLENGYKIKLAITEEDSHSIDMPEDVERVLKLVK